MSIPGSTSVADGPAGHVTVHECGDGALRVVAASGDREADWATVHGLSRWLDGCGAEGLHGAVPTYDAALVEFDPSRISATQVRTIVRLGLQFLELAPTDDEQPRLFEVPVLYGGEYGPDLQDVAAGQGLTVAEVIRLHTEKTYTVRCLGAPAGSPMMDGPEFPFPVPRLKDPRLSVPAGAVSVAGRQAVIAPAVAPGGWCVIGRTPLTVLDASREPLVPYRPGDRLRFHPIGQEEFDALKGRFLEPSNALPEVRR